MPQVAAFFCALRGLGPAGFCRWPAGDKSANKSDIKAALESLLLTLEAFLKIVKIILAPWLGG